MRANSQSEQRAARRLSQLEYALSRDIERATITEEEIALAEGMVHALAVRLSDAEARLRSHGIRSIYGAQRVVDELAGRATWGNDPLRLIAKEYSGDVPFEVWDQELSLSERDPEVREVLMHMIEIAELPERIERLSRRLEQAKELAASGAGNIAELFMDYFVGPLGERQPTAPEWFSMYQDWDVSDVAQPIPQVKRLTTLQRLSAARGQLDRARESRERILRQIGPRIEANRSTVYAIPEREAYPITSAKDAYHATQRLKQGRVKSEDEARRIIAAIKREHHDVWSKYLKDYPVLRIMRSKRKGLTSRHRA